jgi:Transposase
VVVVLLGGSAPDLGRQLGVTRIGIWPSWCALVLSCPLRLPVPAWPTSWPEQKPVRPWGRDPPQMCRSVISSRPVPRLTRRLGRTPGHVPMLAECTDAVVGVDTHRDTHQVEIAYPSGTPIATITINEDSGYAELLAWIVGHAPGPWVAVSIEGTRSYGAGVARAVSAAGLGVLECEQPHCTQRRGKGKSNPIDAHLAALTALQLDADRLPTPRADGDREALRILLGAR